ADGEPPANPAGTAPSPCRRAVQGTPSAGLTTQTLRSGPGTDGRSRAVFVCSPARDKGTTRGRIEGTRRSGTAISRPVISTGRPLLSSSSDEVYRDGRQGGQIGSVDHF